MIKNILYGFRNKISLKSRICIAIISFILLLNVIIYFPHFVRSTYIVTIANKRIIRRNNIDTYLIYTQMEDGNLRVFQDTNSLVEIKVNSENLYWGLTIGGKYEVKVYGLSIPLLSSYQNIIKARGVK